MINFEIILQQDDVKIRYCLNSIEYEEEDQIPR
jgi:hypothetical protein